MPRISRRLVALFTFVVGIVVVWFLQQPAALPSRFQVLVPPVPVLLSSEEVARLPNSCGILVVSITEHGSLKLNNSEALGSVEEPREMNARLSEVFQERVKNRAYDEGMEYRTDLPEAERILRMVVVKAPRSVVYGDVAKVIDEAKGAGASPVMLQLDELPE